LQGRLIEITAAASGFFLVNMFAANATCSMGAVGPLVALLFCWAPDQLDEALEGFPERC
jgi:hypothetical protein